MPGRHSDHAAPDTGRHDRTGRPALSIVIGARAVDGDPRRCLEALRPQIGDDVEVVLVTDAPLAPGAHAWARSIVVPGALVPELWGAGVREATGGIVGLLAATCIPAPDWVDRTRRAHDDGSDVVGGAIEPHESLAAADWAVYFCRYAPYLRPLGASDRLEVPGDNASYRGDVVRSYEALYRDGFWEPFVHAAMRADHRQLRMQDERVVFHAGRTGAAAFCRHRLAHGRVHGTEWARGRSRAQILTKAATAPLVPFLMTARAGAAVFGKRRFRLRFLAVAPVVFVFYTCWATGELVGRVRAALGRGA